MCVIVLNKTELEKKGYVILA